LDPELAVPSSAQAGDAGFDLSARFDGVVPAAGGRLLMATGFALALPEGMAALILPRSGLALRHGLSVVNAPGLVDSGYRGELSVLLLNTDPEVDIEIRRGDRIAQLMLQRVVPVEFVEVSELAGSERGDQGWGSSGR